MPITLNLSSSEMVVFAGVGIVVSVCVGMLLVTLVVVAVMRYRRRLASTKSNPPEQPMEKIHKDVHAASYPKISVPNINPNTSLCGVQPSLYMPQPLARRASNGGLRGITDSIFGAGSPEDTYKGQINFSLSYDKRTDTLHVNVRQAVGLGVRALSTCDPYVRVSLLPDEREIKRTTIQRKTVDPTFEQVLSFKGYSLKQLSEMTLCLSMMDYSRISRDSQLGEVLLPLEGVNLTKSPQYWKVLQKPTIEVNGEIMLSMCWLPEQNALKVVVVRARNLPTADLNGLADPYVKLWLLMNGERLSKKKTTVKCNCLDPVYNETFSFYVEPDNIDKIQLLVVVMDFDRMRSNEEMGVLKIGPHSNDLALKHWEEMLHQPGSHIAKWHHLKTRV